MPRRRVILKDIAIKAGVHVTTVSLALRNHQRIPEATRKRIRELAKKMGYQPDPLLRSLTAYRGNIMERKNRKDFTIRLSQYFDHFLKGAPMPVWMARGVPAVDKGRTMGLDLVDPAKP